MLLPFYTKLKVIFMSYVESIYYLVLIHPPPVSHCAHYAFEWLANDVSTILLTVIFLRMLVKVKTS